MGLQLNVSNSLNDLADLLAVGLTEHTGDIFQKQYLVTQTDGMKNWLTIQLASKMGIHANTKFLKPNDIVNQLYFWVGGESNEVLASDHLKWLIYNLLEERLFVQRFKTIAAYYPGDDVKRIALAGKVADLFDQYQVYRPELLDEWNTATIDDVKTEEWQKYLWIKVKEKVGNHLTDKTSMIRYIIEQMKAPVQQEKIRTRLPQLHIFGVSIITQLHIHLFNELSKYCAVSFYLLNPAPLVYWLDDKTEKQIARLGQLQKMQGKKPMQLDGTGNNLLISWGKVIQETFGLLFENDAFLNVYNDATVTEPTLTDTDTLLQKIQNDIFYNNDAANRIPLVAKDLTDESLTINACYTPVREVEVLYNYLVYLVDQKKEQLSPRDIVVMVSDIDAYAPYIKAVFKTAAYQFPFTIADESVQSGDSLFTAIEAILSITADSFKAEEVMQLLDSHYIRERFDISDTTLLRKVVSMANIRFGIEGSTDDDTALVSWNNGLQRIRYGICMSGSDEYAIGAETIYPLDVAEGADALELVRFSHFIEVLKWYVLDRSHPRNLAAWGQHILNLADNLVFQSDSNEADEDYQRLLQYIENLNLLTETYNEAVSYEVFKHSFLDIIASESRSHSFAVGGITFCSLIPMRSIPFKIVALLGMNFDKFPRRETPLSFNLMEQKRRKGDRNVKENDKHLFLETVLSAQQYLYISYIGRSAKDNSIHPPSALVDELVDYIESGITETGVKVRDRLINTHPLHGFSQKYFQNLPGFYSYLGGEDNGENNNLKKVAVTKEGKIFDFSEIPVNALLSFFKNPFKWYYNKVPGIYYNEDEVLLPDTELFELDGLQQWQLKNDLLQLDEDAAEAYRIRALKTGNAPLKHMSDILIASTMEAVAPVRNLINDCIGDEPAAEVLINIKVEDSVITGKLENVYKDKMLVISFSKNHYKYLLETYLKYVLVTAQGLHIELVYISAVENKRDTIPVGTLSQKAALQLLHQWVSFFKNGHSSIFLLYPELSENPLKIASLTFEKFNESIGKSIGRYSREFLQKEFDNGLFKSPDAVSHFQENTLAFFEPIATLFPQLIPTPKTVKG